MRRGGQDGPRWFASRAVVAEDRMVSRGGISSRDDSAGADGAAWARGVRAVAVLTGAGISTDSGIPDLDATGLSCLALEGFRAPRDE
jgi:hypothetical protein